MARSASCVEYRHDVLNLLEKNEKIYSGAHSVTRTSEGSMTEAPQSIFAIQADLCRAMGSALSQEIVHWLRGGPMSVNDIAGVIEVPPPTISRHLTVLHNAGIVIGQRKGDKVFYRIANPKIIQVCDLMREVLTEQIRLQMVMFTHEKEKK